MFYKIEPEAEQTKVMPQCCSVMAGERAQETNNSNLLNCVD